MNKRKRMKKNDKVLAFNMLIIRVNLRNKWDRIFPIIKLAFYISVYDNTCNSNKTQIYFKKKKEHYVPTIEMERKAMERKGDKYRSIEVVRT
jgi:hypothetical protein